MWQLPVSLRIKRMIRKILLSLHRKNLFILIHIPQQLSRRCAGGCTLQRSGSKIESHTRKDALSRETLSPQNW